jgi:hypothetical protein
LYAVSYDSVEVLADFADKHGITYPLLSDEGSRTIKALGLYNEHLAEHAAFYGRAVQPHQFGIPYPGLFVLDERGVVAAKEFEQSYRVRPTASALAETVLGATTPDGVAVEARTPEVGIRAWLGTKTYRPYQRLRLHVELRIGPGLHVYAPPAGDGLVPLTISVAPFDGLEVGATELPAPNTLAVEGLDEAYLVYEDAVVATVPLAIVPVVPDVRLGIEVGYQVCSDYACYPPSKVNLELPIQGLELIRE